MDGARQGRLPLWIGAAALVHAALVIVPLAPSQNGSAPLPSSRPLQMTLVAPEPAPQRSYGPSRRLHRKAVPIASADAAPPMLLEPAVAPPIKSQTTPAVTTLKVAPAPPVLRPATPSPRERPISRERVVRKAANPAPVPPPVEPTAKLTTPAAVAATRPAIETPPVEAAPAIEAVSNAEPAKRVAPSATGENRSEPDAEPAVAPTASRAVADTRTQTAPRVSRVIDLEPLRRMLHVAIERNRRYPKSALRMGRQGTVGITFTLTPEGEVRDLVTAGSSGVRALDRAAERAVAAIAPFRPAGKFLEDAERFRVEVAFLLN